MKKLITKLLLVCFLSIATGCNLPKEKSEPSSANVRSEPSSIKTNVRSIVIVSDPSISVAPHATYTWLPEAIQYHDDPRIENTGIQPMIQNAIQEVLGEKGHRNLNSTAQNDILIGYTIALQSSLSDSAILNQYGVQPGLDKQRVC